MKMCKKKNCGAFLDKKPDALAESSIQIGAAGRDGARFLEEERYENTKEEIAEHDQGSTLLGAVCGLIGGLIFGFAAGLSRGVAPCKFCIMELEPGAYVVGEDHNAGDHIL
jgi:hypothetical protein